MGKGLKEATAKARKGRGTEKVHQRSSLERSPVQGVPLLVKRPEPRSQAGALKVGLPVYSPCSRPHRGPPPSPPQGSH